MALTPILLALYVFAGTVAATDERSSSMALEAIIDAAHDDDEEASGSCVQFLQHGLHSSAPLATGMPVAAAAAEAARTKGRLPVDGHVSSLKLLHRSSLGAPGTSLSQQRRKVHQTDQTPGDVISSFLSNDGLQCAEGLGRLVESALAVRKANPIGGIYNETFARFGVPCAASGHILDAGGDDCHPGIRLFFQNASGRAAYSSGAHAALRAYDARYSLAEGSADLLSECTCQSSSFFRQRRATECEALNLVGSWVHVDPEDGKELICDEGPFELATLVLATLKASTQLSMHRYDQIAPVTCASRGFPEKFWEIDHCYALPGRNDMMQMWTRENAWTDWGAATAVNVEVSVMQGNARYPSGFERFALANNVSTEYLGTVSSACNCLEHSEVGEEYHAQYNCSDPRNYSPVRDWFHGNVR